MRQWEQGWFASRANEEAGQTLQLRIVEAGGRVVPWVIHVSLADSQFNALVSFTFNVGAGALQRSTLRGKVNRQKCVEVPAKFMRWVWAGGRRLKGLIRRRAAETKFYANT